MKRKLRMKYEGLVNKVRHMDMTIKRNQEAALSDRMLRLEEFVESKKIVRVNNAKLKFKMLRDRV